MAEAVKDLEGQLARSVDAGARIVTGGKRIEGQGAFFQPTVLSDIPPQSPAYSEEFFGPCALMFKISSLEDAITLANDSPFGLGGSVWTQDSQEQEAFIRDLDQGGTHINRMTASDPRLPFGGVKTSGYGRELSREGLHAFMNAKTVTLD